MSVSNNWIPPLPPGYEARWDGNQRAFFFINHSKKETTWIDPRPAYYANQPKDHPPPNPKHSSHGEAVFGFRGAGNVPKKEQTFLDHNDVKITMLKDMFPDVADDTLRVVLKMKNNNVQECRAHLMKSGYKCEQEADHSSAGQLQMENIVKKLQKIYPIARFDIIRDIVAGCNCNESAAKAQLESMGYKPVSQHSQPSSSTRHSSTSRPSSRSRSRTPSPSPSRMSEAEKKKIFNKMKGSHRDMSDDLIKMFLESVDYNESNFERLLQTYNENNSGGAKGGATSTRSRVTVDDSLTFKSGGSLVPESFRGGNEPVVFGHELDERPICSEAFHVPFSSGNHSPKNTSPKKNTRSDIMAKMTKPTKPVQKQTVNKPSRETIDQHAARLNAQKKQNVKSSRETIDHAARLKAQQTQQSRSRPKQVTHVGSSHVVVDQPRSMLAKGPDPTIRRGPDRELLLQEYVNVSGPNPEYHQGPDRSRVQGSQGAMGPDYTLVCGPQAENHSMGFSRSTLVTAV